jgi:hypothetical protein
MQADSGRNGPDVVNGFDKSAYLKPAKLTARNEGDYMASRSPRSLIVKKQAGNCDLRKAIGRKPANESRARELRQELIAWKQTPERSRSSLRTLARELGTSHQLLAFFLKGLDEWQGLRYLRQASQIRIAASDEDRPLSEWEAQRADAFTRTGIRIVTGAILRNSIKRMRKESEHRVLCWQEIKSLKMLAPGFPEAQELLQRCPQRGVKSAKNNLPPISTPIAKPFRNA